MKYNVICRKVDLSDSRKEKLIGKLKKLDKFFDESLECKILISEQKGEITMEITFVDRGFVFRAEARNRDLLAAADGCLSKLDRQIRKNKTKLAKHLRQPAIESYDSVLDMLEEVVDEDKEFNIIKKKKVESKPMTAEEAILQMNMLDHDFYIFRQADTMALNIVYKRKDGNYGLIEVN